MEDKRIIELLFARSETAITALSQKYGRICMGVASNILWSPEDAEECVNDAYLAVWDTIPPEKPNPLLSFVLRIVRNISINRVKYHSAQKRAGNYQECFEELMECVSGSSTPEEVYDARELSGYIEEFLDGLSKTNRLLFVRRYWYQDSFDDLSHITGLRPVAIRTRLFRLRERLKEFLLKRGVII